MIEKKTSVTFGLNMENRNNWIHQYNTNHPKLTPLYTSRFISGYNLPIQGFFRYKNPGKNTILMWIQVIIAILSVYIILSARSVTKKNSYWVRPAIRQMLGNRVQWIYFKKKPIGHMSTFIRISSADINDWSNAIRRQKRPTWSQYWYSLYTCIWSRDWKGADAN